MKIRDIITEDKNNRLTQIIRDFLPIAQRFLKLDSLPKIVLKGHITSEHDQPTFGTYQHDGEKTIEVAIEQRHPVDIVRTLAHELAHYKQGLEGELSPDSWHTGSDEENQAHELAGIMMREFDKQFPEHLKSQAVQVKESFDFRNVYPVHWFKGRDARFYHEPVTGRYKGREIPIDVTFIDGYLDDLLSVKIDWSAEIGGESVTAGLTAAGNAYKILNTIGHAILTYLKQHPRVAQVIMDASDARKKNVYADIAQRMVSAAGFQVTAPQDIGPQTQGRLGAHAIVLKKTPQVSEGWRETAASLGAAGLIGLGVWDDVAHRRVAEPAPQVQVSPEIQKVQTLLLNPYSQLLEKTAKASGIVGQELAALLAQAAHETWNFSSMTEQGDAGHFKKYDIRHNPKTAKILGNTHPGDGQRFKGRGYVQLTGRGNYAAAGRALGLPLEQHPHLAEDPNVAARVAIWYWQNRVAPRVSDFNNVQQVTHAINPRMHGLDDRMQKFQAFSQKLKESAVVEFVQACDHDAWAILEAAAGVEIRKSGAFDTMLNDKKKEFPTVAEKLKDFINFKMANPTQPWGGSDTAFVKTQPLGRAVPGLRHAHLSQNISIFYTIEGRNPTVIKLYGVFTHADSGTGNTANKKRQKSLAQFLKNQAL